ncbi:hypothetical protein TNCV_18041 [Trichonephila clavipes]|nr:hypothetical protein TNCV_18041 [Trichonephila clavipes]
MPIGFRSCDVKFRSDDQLVGDKMYCLGDVKGVGGMMQSLNDDKLLRGLMLSLIDDISVGGVMKSLKNGVPAQVYSLPLTIVAKTYEIHRQ